MQNDVLGNYVHVHNVFRFCNGTLTSNNFLEKDPLGMKSAPIDRAHRDLSIGTGFVEIGAVYGKLWTKNIRQVK